MLKAQLFGARGLDELAAQFDVPEPNVLRVLLLGEIGSCSERNQEEKRTLLQLGLNHLSMTIFPFTTSLACQRAGIQLIGSALKALRPFVRLPLM